MPSLTVRLSVAYACNCDVRLPYQYHANLGFLGRMAQDNVRDWHSYPMNPKSVPNDHENMLQTFGIHAL